MITVDGLHHDISMSQVYYRLPNSESVNKKEGVMSTEWVTNSVCHKHFEQSNLPSRKCCSINSPRNFSISRAQSSVPRSLLEHLTQDRGPPTDLLLVLLH